MAREDTEDAIIAYKSILAQIIDNRPSGTRQRLATELGKHRSFVTQITSPTYATPLPARHLATIFRVCHFSGAEQERFLRDRACDQMQGYLLSKPVPANDIPAIVRRGAIDAPPLQPEAPDVKTISA